MSDQIGLEEARQAVIDLARKIPGQNVPELEEIVTDLTHALYVLTQTEANERSRKISLMTGLRLLPDESTEDDLGDFPQTICGFTISRVKVHKSAHRLPTLQGRRLWSPIVVLELSDGRANRVRSASECGSLVFSSDAPPLDVREKLAPTFPHGVRWAISR